MDAPARPVPWRAVAMLLVLVLGFPCASARLLVDDWYFGTGDDRSALLLEARKSVARVSEDDGEREVEPSSGERDWPAVAPLRDLARALAAESARIAPLRAQFESCALSLLPDSTGPPAA